MKRFYFLMFATLFLVYSCKSKNTDGYDCTKVDPSVCKGDQECERNLGLQKDSVLCTPTNDGTVVCAPEIVQKGGKRTMVFVCS